MPHARIFFRCKALVIGALLVVVLIYDLVLYLFVLVEVQFGWHVALFSLLSYRQRSPHGLKGIQFFLDFRISAKLVLLVVLAGV